MNIKLRIDRLILEGLPVSSTEVPAVRAAVESELARLLATHGLSHEPQGGAIPQVRAGNLQLSAESSPAQLGKQIAQSVHGGIGKANE